MTSRLALRIAAFMGFLGVALGAFGAHGLHALLEQNQSTAIWEKAVFYHLVHAVLLFILAGRTPFSRVPWYAFLLGILLFSGSLYVFALTRLHWLAYLTPLGGLSFLAAWLWLIFVPGFSKAQV